jgi:hypothetical protein
VEIGTPFGTGRFVTLRFFDFFFCAADSNKDCIQTRGRTKDLCSAGFELQPCGFSIFFPCPRGLEQELHPDQGKDNKRS